MLCAARLAALRVVGSAPWFWLWLGWVVLERAESWERLRALRVILGVLVLERIGVVGLMVVVGSLAARYSSGLISGLEDHLAEKAVLVDEEGRGVEGLLFGVCSVLRLCG